MKKLICALIGASALVASAATYIQTSPTGTAPWKPVKDSVSQAHLADSALHAPPSAYADSSRTSGLADSAKRAGWAPLDTGRVRGIVSDTAATLRTGISSAITTSEAYATARISDSLTANARAWTTLTAAKSSVHDTATVLRTYIGSASTTGNAATATKLATARTITTSGDVTGTPTNFDGTANITIPTSFANTHLAGINQDLTTTSSPTFATLLASNSIVSKYGTIDGQYYSSNSSYAGFGHKSCTTAGNYCLLQNSSGITFLNGSTDLHFQINNQPVMDFTSTLASIAKPLTVSGLITANGGISGNLTGTASNASALGGVAASSYLLSSTAASTYLPIGGTASNAVYADSSRISGLADSAKRAGWAPLDTGRVRGIVGDTATTLRTYIGSASTTGNAATATKLATGRTITTSGDVTGTPTNFDGTANVTIPTSFANTHLAGIDQDLTTTSSPTFGMLGVSISYYGVVGQTSADAQKWYLVATVDITSQYEAASAVIRFNSAGSNGASGLGWQFAGSCFIRAKQKSAMSSGLDNFTIGWNYCHGFNPSSAVIGVKTTDNASHKIVNIYLLCPASYDGMSWQIDNLYGSITASGVGTNYVTTLPTGLATYTGSGAIWSDWTNITVPGASTFTGLITANGGISGNLTGTASNAVYADSSRISGLADSAKRSGWAPTDSASVLGITSGAYVRKSGDTMSGALRLSGNYGSGIDFVHNQATFGGVRLWQYGDASTYEGVKFQAIDTSGGSSTLPVWVVADIFSGTSISASTAYVDHLALAGPLSVQYAIYSTNVARTLDPSYLTMFVYSCVPTTQQTLSNGSFSGQVISIKNNTQSSITLVGSFGTGALPVLPESTFSFVWDGTAWN